MKDGKRKMNPKDSFNKACPTGNHMCEPEQKPKEELEYTSEQEDYDMERYFEKKYGRSDK